MHSKSLRLAPAVVVAMILTGPRTSVAQSPLPLPVDSMVTVRGKAADGTVTQWNGIVVPGGGVIASMERLKDAGEASVLTRDGKEHCSPGIAAYNSSAGLVLLEVEWSGERPPGVALAAHAPVPGSRLRLAVRDQSEATVSSVDAEVRRLDRSALMAAATVENSKTATVWGSPLIDDHGSVAGIACGFEMSVSLQIPPQASSVLRARRCEVLATLVAGETIPWNAWSTSVRAACDQAQALVDANERPLLSGQASAAKLLAPLARATELDASNADAWRVLAVAKHLVADYEGALSAIERSIALLPTDAWTHRLRAELLLRHARSDEALAAVDRAIELDPASSEFLVLKALALTVQKQYPEAEECLRERLRSEPEDKRAQRILAQVLKDMGRDDEARESPAQ